MHVSFLVFALTIRLFTMHLHITSARHLPSNAFEALDGTVEKGITKCRRKRGSTMGVSINAQKQHNKDAILFSVMQPPKPMMRGWGLLLP
jgi:hypothetical protein